jgi:hypothetical protein
MHCSRDQDAVVALVAGAGVVQREHGVAQRSTQATGLQRLKNDDLAPWEDQRYPVVVGRHDEELAASASDIPACCHPLAGLASHSPHDCSPLAGLTRAVRVRWLVPAKPDQIGAPAGFDTKGPS